MCRFNLKDAILGAIFDVEFDQDFIELDIPETGMTKDGWAIHPLVYPQVRWYAIILVSIFYSSSANFSPIR